MIRVGLVGFGMAGRVFHAPLISSVEGLELAAVVERNYRQRRRALSRHHHLPHSRRNARRLLARPVRRRNPQRNPLRDRPAGSRSRQERRRRQANVRCLDRDRAADGAGRGPRRCCSSHSITAVGTAISGQFRNYYVKDRSAAWSSFESCFDRWRPHPQSRRMERRPGAGRRPSAGHRHPSRRPGPGAFRQAGGSVRRSQRERDGEGSNDSFTVRLRYPGFSVTLGANCLSALPRPRFHLRGTRGNYWKWGLDPQEAALNKITRIADQPTLGPGTGRRLGHAERGCGWRYGHPARRSPSPATTGSTTPESATRCWASRLRRSLALDAWRVARLLEWADGKLRSSAARSPATGAANPNRARPEMRCPD